MSFFQTECPGCGHVYWTGIVGMQQIGEIHECATEEQKEQRRLGIIKNLTGPLEDYKK